MLFDKYELETQVSRALRRKVWLPSGGYLIVEATEALTTFDVNTGRYTGESAARTTILNTNLEAATEIATQLELRNIGGIVVIDFIDMNHEEDQNRVSELFLEGLKGDRAKTNVLGFSELGLVQLTRKRSTDSLGRIVTESCPTCKGMGRIANSTTEMNHLIRDIVRIHLKSKVSKVSVKARSDIYNRLMGDGQFHLEEIQEKYGIQVDLKPSGAQLYTAKDGPYEIITN